MTIFITTGGTGGHIIPARCLAFELAKDEKIIVLADKKYQNYIKNNDNFNSIIINSSQIVNSAFKMPLAATKIAFGVIKSIFLMIVHRPKYIISFGGYATFPVLFSAIITRRKIILHEQNAHFGKVNRIFAKFAAKIALTFEKTDGISPELQKKCIITGNFVRPEILKLNEKEYILPTKSELKERDKMGYEGLILASEFDDFDEFENNRQLFNILIIGGSGGAQIFSEILPKAFFNLSDEIKNNIKVTQQCRPDLMEETFEQYENFNINIEIEHFFEDMDKKIDEAHLIIARAGSSSLSEFAIAKKPMILVPFALSADNHQLKNAKFFQENEAAILIEEKNFTINNISQNITKLLKNPQILRKMSQNCQKIAILDAIQRFKQKILCN
jgi:UDP-N-acetylglucosamine--N-acetylmuramyl-(pentapeptide) pyrophosphoryl-undecaprenol N-acetylglucosamine transferase